MLLITLVRTYLFLQALAWEVKMVERQIRKDLKDFRTVHIDTCLYQDTRQLGCTASDLLFVSWWSAWSCRFHIPHYHGVLVPCHDFTCHTRPSAHKKLLRHAVSYILLCHAVPNLAPKFMVATWVAKRENVPSRPCVRTCVDHV